MAERSGEAEVAAAVSRPVALMRICIVAHFAYPALSGAKGHIGGVERQVSLLAPWLASRGHEVSVVTWDEGQPDGIEVSGVRIWKTCPREAGLPGLRFFHPRWTSLVSALRRADAEVYYQNCAEYVTGQVALYCGQRRRRFIYSVASDKDCDPALRELRTRRERYLFRLGLRRADRVIVQTLDQGRRIEALLGRRPVRIYLPCRGPRREEYRDREPPRDGEWRILWVGRLSREKRPDLLLDVAEALPEARFDLVGPSDGREYGRSVLERAGRIANITVHGQVAHDELGALYRAASCLCSTSDFEGFPNVFIEAWSHGLPVVARADPDGLLSAGGLGAVAGGDVRDIADKVRGLLGSSERWCAASRRARRHFLENHEIEAVLPRFEQTFHDVLRAR